ncbi:hypothetical protein [Ruminococcus sp.]|uniref:hypothetical protein n=1 Tax=Ruminococcus sp. TaxID=41978 RepID=UPI00386CBDF9
MKNKKGRSKGADYSKLFANKGIVLITILAVLILIVNIITASFSWFVPQEGKRMSYERSFTVRSENCTMSTHIGEEYVYSKPDHTDYPTGRIVYEENASTNSVTISAGERAYFRTIVQNSSDVLYPSNISLFIADFPSTCSIGVESPSNSYRSFSEAKTDLYIVRNAYVKTYVATDVDGPGKLYIDWFVVNNASSSKSVDLSKLYLVYN